MKGAAGEFFGEVARVQSALFVQMATGESEVKTLRNERRKKT
jgi:hypothetical protein